MLKFGSPAVLAAGGVVALVPLLLHLIARRPANRTALPTARFLPHDARTRPRLQRRPADVWLMLLRMLFVLLVAAAFARPVWVPPRTGTVDLVLLDAGSGMAPVWDAALEAARTRLGEGGGLLVFNTVSVMAVTEGRALALLDSLAVAGPAAVESEYAEALRGLHRLAAALPGVDSARAVLVTLPRWEAWSAGLAAVRGAAWPGRLWLVAPHGVGGAAGVGAAAGAAADASLSGTADPLAAATVEPLPGRRAVVLAPPDGGVFVTAALGALGWEVTRPATADTVPAAGVYVVMGGLRAAAELALLDRARAGATVVVAGVPPSGKLAAALPWTGGAATRGGTAAGGDLLVGGGTRLRGAETREAGGPATGARVTAAWDDGHAAAAAHALDHGCLVYVATELERGALPSSPDFPAALARLLDGCAAVSGAAAAGWQAPAGALDAGARSLLEAPAGEERVALEALRPAAGGRPLYRWFLVAALLAALLETMMAYGKRGRFERPA